MIVLVLFVIMVTLIVVGIIDDCLLNWKIMNAMDEIGCKFARKYLEKHEKSGC